MIISKKQESIRKTLTQLFTDYKLTELELNTLVYLQGLILERKIKDKSRKLK